MQSLPSYMRRILRIAITNSMPIVQSQSSVVHRQSNTHRIKYRLLSTTFSIHQHSIRHRLMSFAQMMDRKWSILVWTRVGIDSTISTALLLQMITVFTNFIRFNYFCFKKYLFSLSNVHKYSSVTNWNRHSNDNDRLWQRKYNRLPNGVRQVCTDEFDK